MYCKLLMRGLAVACLAVALFFALPLSFAYAADPSAAPPATLTALLGAYAEPVWITVASLVTIASTWCAFTKTPDPKTTWGKIYSALEVVALLVGRAKETPTSLSMVSGIAEPQPAKPTGS